MTKNENVYFGLMMCTGMVVAMTFYNLFTTGLIGTVSATEVATLEKPLLESYVSFVCKNFIFALSLQLFIVGPLVRYLFARFVAINRPMVQ